MKWGIVSKPKVKKTMALTKDVIEFLQDKKEEVLLEQECAKQFDEKGYSLSQLNKQADIVITLGGDGTILHALTDIEKPIFSINSGGMGFLAEVESKYAIGGLTRVLEKKYNIEERSKLKVTVDGKRLPDAANEVTVQTAQIAKILYLQLFVEEELIETMGADGVIIATPTGSTSYSLSVGGPMMDPAVHAMVIAPIAPFKLSARPWIVPLEKTIRVKLMPKSKESKIVIDGRSAQTVTPQSDIQITLSEKKARFVRFGESFYQMVRLKLVR
jgi:NAD+ kinase